jgi:hypothetical protein
MYATRTDQLQLAKALLAKYAAFSQLGDQSPNLPDVHIFNAKIWWSFTTLNWQVNTGDKPDDDEGVYELNLSMEQMGEFNKLGETEDNAEYIKMLKQLTQHTTPLRRTWRTIPILHAEILCSRTQSLAVYWFDPSMVLVTLFTEMSWPQ